MGEEFFQLLPHAEYFARFAVELQQSVLANYFRESTTALKASG